MNQEKIYDPIVRVWLLIGVIMVFVQVIVGGITRLTESGLSITNWEVVEGTLPPMTRAAWIKEFDLYKKTPQYQEINEGMSLLDFKFIYFWEWVHRFWARFMGVVFLIPFIIFTLNGRVDRAMIRRLGIVVVLAALAAIFGWVMVASGLIERPWVNAYKLAIHLTIAFCVFAALWWTYLWSGGYKGVVVKEVSDKYIRMFTFVTVVFVFQMMIGGVLSGMKAAVVFPTWPDMNGQYLPKVLLDSSQWVLQNFIDYDKNIFLPSLVHFLHRNTAYLLFVVGVVSAVGLYRSCRDNSFARKGSITIIIIMSLQVLLGILTVISSKGKIPVLWGTLHQGMALMLLAALVYIFFILRINKKKNFPILPLG